MLSTLGSIASQSSPIFKGIVWNYGINVFGLPFVNSGDAAASTSVTAGGYYYSTEITNASSSKTTYTYLDLSSLNITGSTTIRLSLQALSPSVRTIDYRILYTDDTYLDVGQSSSNEFLTDYMQAIDANKVLKGIQVKTDSVYEGPTGDKYFSYANIYTRIGYIEVV